MINFFLKISLFKIILFTAVFFAIGLTSSCATSCANIPTYGGRASMVYGHDANKGFEMKKSKNPYFVKAKKPAKSHNYYVNR